MRLLVLYEELAPYFLTCINHFSKKYNVEIFIIRKAINNEAPFELNIDSLNIYDRSKLSNEQFDLLVQNISPTAIFCGGWSYKKYISIVKFYKGEKTTIIGFDNKWNGSLKQHVGRLVLPCIVSKYFDHAFVPDIEQVLFAINIGFKKKQIVSGAYSCDFNLFHNQYLLNKEYKKKEFPRRFIFVGRYYEFKGIKDLWNAFIELQNELSNDWELWCLGTGDIEPIKHEKIRHFGFVQPKDLPEYIKNTGVFVLPSHFEPWGVVVHEFAAAGFPIICSDEVGAKQAFVENGVNGYIYKAGNIVELKSKLKIIMEMNDADLSKMSDESVEKAKTNTPDIWADKLFSMIQ